MATLLFAYKKWRTPKAPEEDKAGLIASGDEDAPPQLGSEEGDVEMGVIAGTALPAAGDVAVADSKTSVATFSGMPEPIKTATPSLNPLQHSPETGDDASLVSSHDSPAPAATAR